MSERFDCAVRLRRLHGMRGYGVYCRIAELTASSPTKKIRYDVDDLAYDMREETAFVRQIVEDFGLFVVEEGWLEDAFARSPEAKERERREQIKRNRSEGARKAAATRRARKDAQAAQIGSAPLDATPIPSPGEAKGAEGGDAAERGSDAKRFDLLKDEWNKRFRRTRRAVAALTPSPIVWQNFKESSAIYSDDDYRDAFDQALVDKKFSWQFKDVLKPSNMQRLLSDFERTRAKKREEEQLAPEQEELIQYGAEHGLNWDDFN